MILFSCTTFLIFFWFLIRNFNSFCSFFYYCNWRKSSHHHAHSRHNANSKWLIFPTTMLIPGNTSIREGRVFIFSQIFINGLTKSSWINKCKTIVVISSIAAHEGSRDWVCVYVCGRNFTKSHNLKCPLIVFSFLLIIVKQVKSSSQKQINIRESKHWFSCGNFLFSHNPS